MAGATRVKDGASSVGAERRGEMLAGYGFIAVPILLFLVLNVGSILYAFYISFFRWGLRGATEFRGLRNYEALLSDDIFLMAVGNTLYYTVLVVPLQMALGLFLAVIVNQKIRGQAFFRAAFYFPAIASSAAITVLWIFIVQPEGLLNGLRAALPWDPIQAIFGIPTNWNWIARSETSLETIMALNIWTTSGTMMLFYLGFLQTISGQIYEAAAIDGAGPRQAFWKITFPLLAPGHFFVATVSVIGALQVFDQAYIGGGSGGDPNNSLMTIVLYLYNQAIRQFSFGYAAAVGIVLFAIIFTATLVQRRLFGQAPAW